MKTRLIKRIRKYRSENSLDTNFQRDGKLYQFPHVVFWNTEPSQICLAEVLNLSEYLIVAISRKDKNSQVDK